MSKEEVLQHAETPQLTPVLGESWVFAIRTIKIHYSFPGRVVKNFCSVRFFRAAINPLFPALRTSHFLFPDKLLGKRIILFAK
jgi:hypothetical protein